MSTLFAALHSASNALDVMEQAMGVIQNNVTNASTPGYVTQTLNLKAEGFNAQNGLWGGVATDGTENSRSQYAEESVWNQSQALGSATQQATSLSSLQSIFDVSGQSGIPAALSSLYSAFSAWSAQPTDTTSQQQVITAAQGIAQAFNQASTSVQQISAQTDQQLQSSVTQINQLASQIASMNAQIRGGDTNDAGLQANMYNTLEQLSNLANISVQNESDGTVTVLMDGQIPLVLGTSLTELQVTYLGSAGAPNAAAPPDAHIMTSGGQDVTSIVSGGQIAALLQFRNVTLPSVTGNGQQQGSLNQLAQAIADRVNTLLESGQTASGTSGVPLFSYTVGSPTSTAASLSVNSNITGAQLAAVDPGPPAVSNGIATQLAGLSNGTSSADTVNGMSYTDFYSNVASGIGAQQASASTAQQTQTQLVTQAQNMRAQISGVSLNDQAADLLQFQQAYEASSQMISIINNTTQFLLQSVAQMQG
jgi:flagellar hook-associated protein 1 FlgK